VRIGIPDASLRNDRKDMDALPFCEATLRTMRCPYGPYFAQVKGYPANPKTIGEAIRKRRLDLGLRQIDVAGIIDCDELTIVHWEKGHRIPRINHMTGIVRFLGYIPLPEAATLAELIVNHRKALGITQEEFARELGVDPSTLARWERAEREPRGRYADAINARLQATGRELITKVLEQTTHRQVTIVDTSVRGPTDTRNPSGRS
jgi:transcriptional regulator with XRE-family HTH domain